MLSTLHLILVISFVGVTALLLALTVLQRVRIRRVRMTWRTNRVNGLPVWPILFVGAVVLFLVYAQNILPSVPVSVYVGYLVGGVLWFIAVMVSTTSVVTDYGLIPEIGRSGEAVAWGQISDYFEVPDERRVHFVFIYQDFIGVRQRLELSVPSDEVDRFLAIVRSKLEIRLEESVHEIAGSRALERE